MPPLPPMSIFLGNRGPLAHQTERETVVRKNPQVYPASSTVTSPRPSTSRCRSVSRPFSCPCITYYDFKISYRLMTNIRYCDYFALVPRCSQIYPISTVTRTIATSSPAVLHRPLASSLICRFCSLKRFSRCSRFSRWICSLTEPGVSGMKLQIPCVNSNTACWKTDFD